MALFSYDLFRRGCQKQTNQCMCAHGIYTLLDLLLRGARNDTRSEILDALKTPPNSDGSVSTDCDENFNSVCCIFVDQASVINDEYVAKVRSDHCLIENVSFKYNPEVALICVNEFVKDRTKGKIENILDYGTVDSSTSLVLVSAVHFKSSWLEPFDPRATKPDHFMSTNGNILADFMYQDSQFRYNEISDCKVVEIPYKNMDYNMLIFLPRYTKTLDSLVQNLTPEFVSRTRSNMNSQSVEVYLPKFKISVTSDLKSSLSSMGVRSLFTNADLSGMTGDSLFVQTVIQKVFIEVNEFGTEAAAGSAVVLAKLGLRDLDMSKTIFKADRPFLFLILRNDQPILVGKLMEPDLSTRSKKSEHSKKGKRNDKCEIL